jgi:hypothetical protein
MHALHSIQRFIRNESYTYPINSKPLSIPLSNYAIHGLENQVAGKAERVRLLIGEIGVSALER